MKNLKLHLLFILSICVLAACSKDFDSTQSITIKSNIASCCNPWDDFLTSSNTHKIAVEKFLESEGIKAKNLEIEDGLAIVLCGTCCGCPTGNAIVARIMEVDLDKAIELGFERD